MKRALALSLAVLQFSLPVFAAPMERLAPPQAPLSPSAAVTAPAVPSMSIPAAALPALPAMTAASLPNISAPALKDTPSLRSGERKSPASAAPTAPASVAPQARAAALEPAKGAAAPAPSGEGAADASAAGRAQFDGAAPAGPKSFVVPELPAERPPFFARHFRLARALITPALKFMYRVRASGLENLPQGPALIVANHVSYSDPVFMSFAANRPMRYVMYKGIYDRAPRFFASLGAMPILSPKDGGTQDAIAESLGRARAALKNGESVVIFPEGRLTRTGAMGAFKRGFERVVAGLDVPVIPANLDNLWGSFFSRKGATVTESVREIPREIGVRFGAPLPSADAKTARDAVQRLSADAMEARVRRDSATLPRAFFRMAKRIWSKRAVSDSTGMSLTYGRALAATVLLAGSLNRTLPPAKRVGVLLPPSVGGTLANTALASAGRIPVNLNYTASAEAVEHALKTAEIETVLTSRKVVDVLKKKGAVLPNRPFVYIEDLLQAQPKWKQAAVYLALRVLPSRLAEAIFLRRAPRSMDEEATVVFTSGSTALPKGVVLTHLNLQSNIEMVSEAYPFTREDSMLGVLPFFHSFGLTISLWFPLVRGLSSALHSHPLEMEAIGKLARTYKPTILLGTPTFLQRYADKIAAEDFASLRHVIAGAEKLRAAVADSFQKKFGARPLEGYGSTELSPVAAVSVPDKPGEPGSKEGSVGRNLPGTAVKIVDPETGEELPYGRQGLLLVKGPHVMKGYLKEPAKTAAVLKDGWYDTGDAAVIDKDGFIFLKGRLGSRFSKIAGEMVPHEAVEEKLHQAAGLSDQTFVVTAVPDERRGERLVVLYTRYDAPLDALLAKAKELGLPGLWTPAPSSFYKVDAFPVLGTGKLDLKALKELALKLAAGA